MVRKDVLDDPEYTPDETRRVYAELLDRGREAVRETGGVVLDGTFKRERQRADARNSPRRSTCRSAW